MKIISGMQSGADIAGVKVGRALGLEVGGFMPAGFRTERGSRPHYAGLYNAVCTAAGNYQMRTRRNVASSDVTIIFGNISSSGSRLTKNACIENGKPYLHIAMNEKGAAETIVRFLEEHEPRVLNIAGNRESSMPGIESFVRKVLAEALCNVM